ncbi:response regulator [Candidatus Saccharibacteria bacterium]|nr:response regulator [Candidatus Saccharibacteria bacterium]
MCRILFIETDTVLAANLRSFFGQLGHEVEWHVNPQLAVFSADDNKPDLVILDLMLAGRSGVEFLYEFRSYPDWQDLPVVVFSNVSERELGQSISSFPHLNISAYHYKPQTTLSQLAQTIDKVLNLPRHETVHF